MSKKIINGEYLRDVIKEGIDLLCNTVKVTLGPKGRNVIIDSQYTNPFITNDGVTIAKEVESNKDDVNVIINLAKEASIKTNDVVGDGTTTTLVLLQAIYYNGLKEIKNGYNPIILKKEMTKGLELITKNLKKMSRKSNLTQIKKVATISSNDEEIGNIIYEIIKKGGENIIVNIEETKNPGIKLEFVTGMQLDNGPLKEFYNHEEVLNNAYILIIDDEINKIDEISNILENIIKENKDIVIVAHNFSDEVINTLSLNKLENILNVYLVRANDCSERTKILEDLSILTNGKIIRKNNFLNIDLTDLGVASKIKIIKNNIVFINENADKNKLAERINEIKKELKENEENFSKEYIEKRLAYLSSGVAIIKIGANSKTELIERKMRLEDALCASASALKNGILPGGGVAYLNILKKITSSTTGLNVLLSSLEEPIKQIITNVGLDHQNIIENLKIRSLNSGFDVLTENFCNVISANIIDPTEVVIYSLQNATSVASMLLTTEVLIVNEDKKDFIDETELSKVC